MSIVSVSLTDKNLEDLDKLQKMLGLAGRSEAIRVCLRSAEAEIREREKLEGAIEGIVIAVHKSGAGHEMDEASHQYRSTILTQVHSHLKNGKCLDVFLVSGDAGAVRDMMSAFQKNEGLEYIKFVQS
ncbi:CopG family ribbon-helix-helix protein [Methanomassiliicoccus luminyensis]|uniref:CopG family ribbon-helix-helix protein n=1 Tax=Methanomassiliicoccus luminyensis TaxID=1080712 RepID=UPI000365E0A0|nr:CopG family ribbon-helix-helix protein [Methanomassiliicoccus luminyensis]